MIVVRLIGGLGNQCFQYAVGRHLSEIHHTELKIDMSGLKTYKWHAYSLNHYNIIENFAAPEDVIGLKQVREKNLPFDREILSLSDGVYLHGYWGSEKYFIGIADIIRRELTVKLPLSGKNKEIAEQIVSCESVSIHIRRTDYLPNTYTEQILEPCSLDYYLCAAGHIAHTVKCPHFFIFTDDKAWARENFQLPYATTLVDHNGPDNNYEDMRLMTLCKHNIIANSSFSWWGAWLNKNQNKKVYAPAKWFNSNARNLDPKDIIPSSWIKI